MRQALNVVVSPKSALDFWNMRSNVNFLLTKVRVDKPIFWSYNINYTQKMVISVRKVRGLKLIKRAVSSITACMLALCMMQGAVLSTSAAKTGTVSADVLNVRSGAGTGFPILTTIKEGQTVTISGEDYDQTGLKWYKITTGGKTGYVSSWYIDLDDTSSTGTTQGSTTKTTTATTTVSADKDFENYMTQQGFPDSYKPMLRELHARHPSWIFKAQQLGIEWKDALNEQLVIGRSLVPSYALTSWKSMEKGAYDFSGGYWYGLDGSWVAASPQVVKYYMDPRNFLDDTYIFMFENLSYNKKVHNIDGVRAILSDTFMKGSFTAPDTGVTYSYAQTFMDAAAQSGVSPYHLAARCRNEQGVWGAPQSLGTTPGYEGYFNFFDVMAYATSTLSAEQMGCKYAMTTNPTYLLPWTNQYKSIVGGSIFLGTGYITKGQDTLYLQKFDVVDGGNGYYYHQYMTCIFGQANEAVSLCNAYSDAVKASALEFKIPVYENMPQKLCPEPTSDGDNNNYLKSLSVSGYNISPAFDQFTQKYTLTVAQDVSSIKVNAKALGANAKVSGSGSKALEYGKNTIKVTVTAASGEKRTYTLTVTRKGSGTTQTVKGDADGNGRLTLVDALTIMKYSTGKIKLSSTAQKAADYNGDGIVNVVDALSIMKKLSE